MQVRPIPSAVAGALALLAFAPRADAHSIPHLYLAAGPAAAYDPLQAQAYLGGAFLFGFGVDPERDGLLVRGDFYAAYGRGPRGVQSLVGAGASILYRRAFRWGEHVVWSWALGPAVLATGRDDAGAATVGVRGELGVRLGGWVRISAFAVAGPTVGQGVRIPWGAPMGVSIDLGLP